MQHSCTEEPYQKHARYLLNPTILSGTLKSSVITALKERKQKKISNSHYNEQFRRHQKTLCCENQAQHKASAHTEVNTPSQLKLFVLEETFRPHSVPWLQRQRTSFLLYWIYFSSAVCYHQWKNLFVIHAADRFKSKRAKLLQCLDLDLLSHSLCLLLSDMLLPGDTNQCQYWFQCPFWYSDFLSCLPVLMVLFSGIYNSCLWSSLPSQDFPICCSLDFFSISVPQHIAPKAIS